MARILLIFSLFFVGHIIKADTRATSVGGSCGFPNTIPTDSYRRDNLTKFLWNLSSQAVLVSFYNATGGDDIPNKVYGLFQCRYDLSQPDCQICVENAVQKMVTDCIESDYPFPVGDGATYYDECMVEYAYHNIFSFNKTTIASEGSMFDFSDEVSTLPSFNKVLAKAMDEIIKAAVKRSNGTYFAANETNITSSEKLYCFAQCSPILNGSDCEYCLRAAFSEINNFNSQATMFCRFCQLRYDNKSFLFQEDSISPSPLPPLDQGHEVITEPPSNKGVPMKPAVIVAISIAASFGLLLLIVGLWLFLRKTPQESFGKMPETIDELKHGVLDDIDSLESLQFDFKGVQAATCNFSEENKLGQGGFGEVYKGNFSNGEEIAVKRLSKNSQQGGFEFKNEVVLLAKLQHKNLVKLLGFCISRKEKILIYEFLSNSSLDRFLYDPVMRASLEWELRFRIITGISRGLLYLHEDSRLKIIHRDLKTSNILLDEEMNAKIADFGIAKLFDSDQTQGNTMRIAGTYGYMAPEYALAGHFSVKSDVYSFGVIILEIVSGQRNEFFQQEPNEGLLHRAWRLWNEDATLQLVDHLLSDSFSKQEAMLCIQIGLLCVQEDAAHRPRMTSVVHALNGESITLPSPNAPHIFTISSDNDATPFNYDLVPVDEVRLRNFDESDGAYTGTMSTTDVYPR